MPLRNDHQLTSMQRSQKTILALIALVGIGTTPALAQALPGPTGVLPAVTPGAFNDVFNQYNAATKSWLTASLTWASLIFSGIILLEITWSFVEAVINELDMQSIVSMLMKRIIYVGTALFIIASIPIFVTAILQDFLNIGNNIASSGGVPTDVTPDSVFNDGFNIAAAVMESTRNDGFIAQALEALPQTLAALLILISYAVVAAQLLLTEIQILLVVGGGAFMVGFIGSRWTMPYAEGYLRMIIQSGLKLVAITLVVGLGKTLGLHWLQAVSKPHAGMLDYISIAASSVVYALIAWHLPGIMQAFAGASSAISASSVASSAYGAARQAISSAGRGGGGGGGGATGGSSSSVNALEKATSLT